MRNTDKLSLKFHLRIKIYKGQVTSKISQQHLIISPDKLKRTCVKNFPSFSSESRQRKEII